MASTKIGPLSPAQLESVLAAIDAGTYDQWLIDNDREGLGLLIPKALLPEGFAGHPLIHASEMLARALFTRR